MKMVVVLLESHLASLEKPKISFRYLGIYCECCFTCYSSSYIECRSSAQGSVVGPFSHVAVLLSCVVSLEFEQFMHVVPVGPE